MRTPLDHPWLARPSVEGRIGGFRSDHRDAIRTEMKSVVAMLESANPPEWIIVIDQCHDWFSGYFTARTRVVIDQHATLDAEGHRIEAPLTTLLSDSEKLELLSVLNGITPESLANLIENRALEGSDFAIMVANGSSSWCEFTEFRAGGMSPCATEVWGIGNELREIVYSFRYALEDAHKHSEN